MLKILVWRARLTPRLAVTAFILSMLGATLLSQPAGALVRDTLETVTRPVFKLLTPSWRGGKQESPSDTTTNSPTRSGGNSANQPNTSSSPSESSTQPQSQTGGSSAPSSGEIGPVEPIEGDKLMQEFEPTLEPDAEVVQAASSVATDEPSSGGFGSAAASSASARSTPYDQERYEEQVFGIDWQLWFVILMLSGIILLHLINNTRYRAYETS